MLSEGVKIFLVYALACLIWGSTWLAIKAGLESLTPMFSAGVRFAVASLMILGIMKFKNLKVQIDKISVRLYLFMGFFSFVIPFSLVYWAEQFVPSGLAAVLFTVYPFFVAIFSYFLISKDSIDKYKIIGMILGFGGILIIFSDSLSLDFSDYFLGMAAIVFSALIQSTVAIFLKKYGNHLNPLTMNFVPMSIAGFVLIPLGLLFENTARLRFDQAAFISVFYLAAFGSVVTFTSYYWLLKRINVVLLSLMTFITPIIALFIGWIFYNELLSSRDLLGCIFVLAGLVVANFMSLKKLNRRKIIKEKLV